MAHFYLPWLLPPLYSSPACDVLVYVFGTSYADPFSRDRNVVLPSNDMFVSTCSFLDVSVCFFLDIDECKLFHTGQAGRLCLHACVNTAGGYRCTCPVSYNVTRDGRNCKGHSLIAKDALGKHYGLDFILILFFCVYFQILTSVDPGRTTARATSSASTPTGVFSALKWSVHRYGTPPMLKPLQRKQVYKALLFKTKNKETCEKRAFSEQAL